MRMRNELVAGVALLACAGGAFAGQADFRLDLHSLPNQPTFELRNLASSTADITSFNFTAGPANRGFDFYDQVVSTGPTFTFNGLDTVDNGLRSHAVDLDFAGFVPGTLFSFRVDLDGFGNPVNASNNIVLDFQTVFFNNGSTVQNSVLTVQYADGQVLSLTLPETPLELPGTPSNHYQFALSEFSNPIPEPQTYAMLLAGLGLLGFAARRKVSPKGTR
jgi:hypothetical protein